MPATYSTQRVSDTATLLSTTKKNNKNVSENCRTPQYKADRSRCQSKTKMGTAATQKLTLLCETCPRMLRKIRFDPSLSLLAKSYRAKLMFTTMVIRKGSLMSNSKIRLMRRNQYRPQTVPISSAVLRLLSQFSKEETNARPQTFLPIYTSAISI